jgi:lysosomal alpha-mannosidase
MKYWLVTSLTLALVVHFVPHSHIDLGWLKTIDEYYMGCSATPQYESVRTILSSVVGALLSDSRRRFVFAEVAFFKTWWGQQTLELQEKFRGLVASGQFEFVGGGWSSPDEACTEYWELLETYTLGHDFLSDEFGVTPTISWQIDPFGHSAQMAELLSQMGFTTAVVNRIHYKDRERRRSQRSMEFMWQPFNHTDSRIFTHVLYNHYSAPTGLDFDNPYRSQPFNLQPCSNAETYASRLQRYVLKMQLAYPTDHLLVPMGDDFQYSNAALVFQSLDGLRDYVNMRPELGLTVRLSSLTEYFEAVRREQPVLEVKYDDFFPYANEAYSYWTGYYTSRPWIKHAHKLTMVLMKSASQLFAFRAAQGGLSTSQIAEGLTTIQDLREVVALMSHHDAVTGTSRMLVNVDYLDRIDKASTPVQRLMHALAETQAQSCGLDTCQVPLMSMTVFNPSLITRKQIVEASTDSPRVYAVDSNNAHLPCETYKDRTTLAYTLACAVVLRPLESLTIQVYIGEQEPLHYIGYGGETLENSEYAVTWSNNTLHITHHNNTLSVGLSYQAYLSSAGNTLDTQASGAYVFRPAGGRKSHCDFTHSKLIKGSLQDKLWLKCGTVVETVVTLKKTSDDLQPSITHFVKGLWGNVGKELVVVYDSPLRSDSFITDTNSLHNLTRTANYKPDYEFSPSEPVAGNYYPITSFLAIRDNATNETLAVVTDHAQGASADQGCIEVMLLRVCLNDDGKGLIETMPERDADGTPFKEKTEHRLVFGLDEGEVSRAQREFDEPLIIFYGPPDDSLELAQGSEPLNFEAEGCLVDLALRKLRSLVVRVLCNQDNFDLSKLVEALLPAESSPRTTELSLNEQISAAQAKQRREEWLWGDQGGEDDQLRVRVFRVEW